MVAVVVFQVLVPFEAVMIMLYCVAALNPRIVAFHIHEESSTSPINNAVLFIVTVLTETAESKLKV